LYRRAGRHADAAARFARAYAAGGGAEALWLNAQALFQAGDVRAATKRCTSGTQVPDGLARLSEARAELFPRRARELELLAATVQRYRVGDQDRRHGDVRCNEIPRFAALLSHGLHPPRCSAMA